MGIADAVFKRSTLINERGDQFGGIDAQAAHFGKVGDPSPECVPGQFLKVIDQSHRHDGIGAQVGTDDKWLGFVIANHANTAFSIHFLDILFEF
ncbi:MAG: hypothetical protein BWY09_01050 [Candidatus Hydrogenedentes bacterium ADurb.Bin179]|nr:MAG: hypothetical protein BWY09_01050 [Candidatus Hydrogenedentes bacterium ADurb.Bin179]